MDRHEREELAARFFDALTVGDVEELRGLLVTDVVVNGDGGGKASQWMRVVVGMDNVARMYAGPGRRFAGSGLQVEPREVSGQPGAVFRDADGHGST